MLIVTGGLASSRETRDLSLVIRLLPSILNFILRLDPITKARTDNTSQLQPSHSSNRSQTWSNQSLAYVSPLPPASSARNRSFYDFEQHSNLRICAWLRDTPFVLKSAHLAILVKRNPLTASQMLRRGLVLDLSVAFGTHKASFLSSQPIARDTAPRGAIRL